MAERNAFRPRPFRLSVLTRTKALASAMASALPFQVRFPNGGEGLTLGLSEVDDAACFLALR